MQTFTANNLLAIDNLVVRVNDKEVVRDLSLTIRPGEMHALMGPNGSGKSSLAHAIAGHPEYRVVSGSMRLGEMDLSPLKPEERAEAGIFLSFQEPPEVGGVSMRTFLRTISQEVEPQDCEGLTPIVAKLGLQQTFLSRFLNEGFSGGEKKKSELLQFLARKPKFAIFDEIDSGLDVDSLQSAARIIGEARDGGAGFLVITHAPRLFSYLNPDYVHVLIQGKRVVLGGREVVDMLEKSGYGAFAGSAV